MVWTLKTWCDRWARTLLCVLMPTVFEMLMQLLSDHDVEDVAGMLNERAMLRAQTL